MIDRQRLELTWIGKAIQPFPSSVDKQMQGQKTGSAGKDDESLTD
jgi:hypothetical protein